MKKFDVVFVDMTTPFPYEPQTLLTRGMGGTEASVIRVAEALAYLGAHVGVVQHNLEDVIMGQHAYYLPLKMLDEIDMHHLVMLRGIQFIDKFPKAKKYSWHEDVASPIMGSFRSKFIEHDVTVIAASKWHKDNIKSYIVDKEAAKNPRTTYIYNPVPDNIYIPKNVEVKYNPNKLVWIASPHKGLNKAVDMFNRVVEVSGNKDLRLHTFNPGYFRSEEHSSPYLIEHGPVPCKELWQHVSESLCVFYPTEFKETFGCIAAEANALHTPLITHEIAALAETVSSQRQFVERGKDKEFIERVISWNKGDRPKVWGQPQFRLTNVVQRWSDLLNGKILND